MSSPLTDDDLAKIEARANAAENGWSVVPDADDPYRYEIHGDGPTRVAVFGGDPDDSTASYPTEENTLFAAHARSDVPMLVHEVRRLNAELAKYVGWEPTVKDEYEHACAVAERAEAVVKAFEVGPRLEVNQFVADLKDALEMPGSRQPEGDAPRCSCYRSPFDHEYECPQAVVTQNGVDYPIGKQCLDRDGARWSFWGESATGEPMVKLFPFNDAYEPGLLSTVVDEHGPLAVVDALPDAKGGF